MVRRSGRIRYNRGLPSREGRYVRPLESVEELLWGSVPPGRGPVTAGLIHAGRFIDRLIDDVYKGYINLYAMSLVYTTLLSIVPVLAVSFSVLKAFGVHNQLEPTLLALLAPLGSRGVEITTQIITFVDNIKVGVLGALGLVFLMYTVISLMQKVEAAFNFIWKTDAQRSLSRRFSDYLSVILVGPVLVFTAIGITGTAMSSSVVQWLVAHEPAGILIAVAGRVLPFVLVVAAFTFVYRLVPVTRVQLASAFVGALVAGVLWEAAGLVFASFIATSTKYTAIYSGFAIGVLAIIWLYLSWLILLVGCRIAFYHQHPEYLWQREPGAGLAPQQFEALVLRVMLLVGRRFQRREGSLDLPALVAATGATRVTLERALAKLQARRLLATVAGDETAYMPGAPLDGITLADVFRAARGELPEPPPDAAVDQLVVQELRGIEALLDGRLREQTLAELVARLDPADPVAVRESATGS